MPEPAIPPAAYCDAIAPGAPGEEAPVLALSQAHALLRFFGSVLSYSAVDGALVEALEPEDGVASPDLAAYAAVVPQAACARTEAGAALPDAPEVVALGAGALVRPGASGGVTLPAEAAFVVVDLRDLPSDTPRAALEAAVAPALAAPIPRAQMRVRKHEGMVDEVFSATNVYKESLAKLDQAPIPASGSKELPLVLLTGDTMGPEAAELAGTLRLARRARVLGGGVRAEVAESRWVSIGAGGLAVRTSELRWNGVRWPDVIPADARGDAGCAEKLDLAAPPPEVAAGPDERPVLAKPEDPFKDTHPEEMSLGTARAALVATHGALRRFFPYEYDADELAARLDETLAGVGAPGVPDRKTMRNLLRRLNEVMKDGHCFVFDYGSPPADEFLVVMIEDVEGEAVIRRSQVPGLDPGDTIVSIAGVPAADFYEKELQRTSAATDGYRFNIATREFLRMKGPTELELRDPQGKVEKVTAQPQSLEAYLAHGAAASHREAGWLDDLGAPDLYYINLDGEVLTAEGTFLGALEEAAGAKGLVLDMRGYPGINHYPVAQRLIQEPFSSPRFLVPIHTGPDSVAIDESSIDLNPKTSPSYDGPIVLLVGHYTVSAAENFATMLVDANRVTVVGRQSAGTNGNITGIQLPGAFGSSFTGMVVQHTDGSPFMGIGILPDVDVALTAADFAQGKDPELEAAIEALSE